ncbi:helix-turn-helix domain-containing protein [Streptomyces sp. NPDC018019]|uniref:helix-turn-helix domain-containing protein n=1 Tax=Streptomyces sp. NPDC018019 TaxID=3365030 RepID=UPI0037947FE5
MINAPPTVDHVIVEVQVRDYGFSSAQQDEIWRRWRAGQSFSLIGRALGAPMHHVRQFLYQSGGIRLTPQQRSERHLAGSEREEISRGIAAGESARQLAKRLGRSPSTVSREIARNGGRDRYRAASADAAASTARSWRPGGGRRASGVCCAA